MLKNTASDRLQRSLRPLLPILASMAVLLASAAWGQIQTGPRPTVLQFTKHPSNPGLSPGAAGSWDETRVEQCSVIKVGATYMMYYSGTRPVGGNTISQVGLATSNDGVTWTKHPANPVLSPGPAGWENFTIASPSVIFDGSKYHMWYWGVGTTPGSIGYAMSTDGVTWTKNAANPVLLPGAPGAWDDYSIKQMAVVQVPSGFYLWYVSDSFGLAGHIGLATSPDGVSWTKHPANPVIAPSQTWESSWVQPSSVFYDGAQFFLFYTGYSPGLPAAIGCAASFDGVTWTKSTGNPVLTKGAAGTWEDDRVVHGSVLREGDEWRMWYSGSEGPSNFDAAHIGLATAQPNSVLITRLFVDSDGSGTYSTGDTLLAENLVNGVQGTTITATVGQTIGLEGVGQAGFTVRNWQIDFDAAGVQPDAQGTGAILGLNSYGTAGSYTAQLDITYGGGTTLSASVTIDVRAPIGGGSVWIVENQIRSRRSIAGDCVPFKVDAVPSSLFADAPTLEIWNGSTWVDLAAFVTQDTWTPNSGKISLDVVGAITASILSPGAATPFRTRVGSVVSANDPSGSQTGLQGPIILTPTSAPADVVGNCAGQPDHAVAVNPNEALLAELGTGGLVEILLGTVTVDCTLRVFEPAAGDVPSPPAGAVNVVVRDISLLAGGAELQPGRPVRVRLFYPDADQDGVVDGNPSILEASLRIVHFTGGAWVQLDGMARNDAENWVEGTTNGFSEFALQSDTVTSGSGGGGGCYAVAGSSQAALKPLLVLAVMVLLGSSIRTRRRANPAPGDQ